MGARVKGACKTSLFRKISDPAGHSPLTNPKAVGESNDNEKK